MVWSICLDDYFIQQVLPLSWAVIKFSENHTFSLSHSLDRNSDIHLQLKYGAWVILIHFPGFKIKNMACFQKKIDRTIKAFAYNE